MQPSMQIDVDDGIAESFLDKMNGLKIITFISCHQYKKCEALKLIIRLEISVLITDN